MLGMVLSGFSELYYISIATYYTRCIQLIVHSELYYISIATVSFSQATKLPFTVLWIVLY